VIQDRSVRLALALPIGSPREIIAAIQIVIFLLRRVGKTELDLLDRPADPSMSRQSGGPDPVLLAAVNTGISDQDARARVRLEQVVRARIERDYTRQGIVPVTYDLQLL
jgi:hypothetical protein